MASWSNFLTHITIFLFQKLICDDYYYWVKTIMTYGYSLQFLPYRPTRGAIGIDKVIYNGEIFTDKELFSDYLRRVYLDIYVLTVFELENRDKQLP